MIKKNVLLEAKWKQRTHTTNLEHLKLYTNNSIKVAFLGDSMMERWLTTGKPLWDCHFHDCANLGVGGDGIEHLLYRLNEGILNCGIQLDKIVFQIGTNNISNKSIDNIFEGIVNIINIISLRQIGAQIIFYGLLPRSDVSPDKIRQLNNRLEDYIRLQGNNKLIYRYFGDRVNDSKFFADHVHLNELGYEVWLKDILSNEIREN